MNTLSSKKMLNLELLWWILTLLLCALVLLPIFLNIPSYPFWGINVAFIITFITTARYIFLLRFTFLARMFWLKFIIVFLSLPFVFYLIQELNGFQTFLDEEGIEAVVGLLPLQERLSMAQYVRNEMVLFGVGAIIGSVILPFRLLIAIWRVRNRNGAV